MYLWLLAFDRQGEMSGTSPPALQFTSYMDISNLQCLNFEPMIDYAHGSRDKFDAFDQLELIIHLFAY